MGSSFGKLFKVTTFGESHGPAIGVVIEGCPSNIKLDLEQLQYELTRRKPGQSSITTPRKEDDSFEILSGMFEGKTLGTPICIIIRNTNTKTSDYDEMKTVFRPSHADFTYFMKYGFRAWPGGGRASARETAARVAAGAVAKQVLQKILPDFEILACVSQVANIKAEINFTTIRTKDIEASIVRCPNPDDSAQMEKLIKETKRNGDSVGGIVSCHIKGIPPGLGEPVFSKLEAELGKAMLSIPAAKGFEIGSGFTGTTMKGSEHNDIFTIKKDKVKTKSNYSGGIQGGISNGESIYFNTAFKPTATILKEQPSLNEDRQEIVFKGKGRHDPCVLPRAVPIVEAMSAITLLDYFLLQKAKSFDFNSDK